MRADVVVVGAGPAGCVLARRLAEAGADVVLLEAGDHVASPRAGLLDVGPDSHVVIRHQARLGGTVLELPRGRTLGGSGAVNGGYCVAARPSDLVSWGPDWPRRHAVGLARAAERLRPTPAPMDPVAARVAAAFPGRVSAVAQARRGARRVTAFDAWDPPGAGVRVRTGARVARLSWADGAAGGRCDGVVLAAAHGNAGGGDDDNAGGEVVATDLVVLCAGTIGSATLLRNSGLGESTGHPVGERVQEHPEVLLDLPAGVAADVSPDHGVTAHRGTEPGEAALVPLLSHVIRFGLDEAPGPIALEAPEIEVRPYAVPLHHVIPGVDPMPLRVGVALMNPLGFGRIDMNGTVFLPDDPRDAAALYTAAAIVADRLGLGEAEPVPSTSQHLSGSARIGEVVDHTGRVMGVDGLYVADASVLPTLPRCGPYYTVLAVAEALAAGLTAERPW